MSTKDLRQEANELYEHRDDPDLAGEEVDLKPGGPLNMVIPVRFRDADAAAVSRAAEEAGMPVSTFIRQAAVAAASETGWLDREALTEKVETLSRDVDELRRLAS